MTSVKPSFKPTSVAAPNLEAPANLNSGSAWQMHTLGLVHSSYPEKFAVPRQPGLVPSAKAFIELLPPYNQPEVVAGLESCSHIWVSFVFHLHYQKGWKPKVRPPRLGGNKKIGVLASRAPFRPNPLGLSVVRLEKIDLSAGVRLHISGADFVNLTPVLDIKPYIPWVDSQPDAVTGWIEEPPPTVAVSFAAAALAQLAGHPQGTQLQQLIQEVLAQNPRPAYQQVDSARIYGVRLADVNVQFVYNSAASIQIVDVVGC